MSHLIAFFLTFCTLVSSTGTELPQPADTASGNVSVSMPLQAPVAQGLVVGSVVGNALSATMLDAGGATVGTVTITLGTFIVYGQSTGTSLGNSILLRGFESAGSQGGGSVFAAARYVVPGSHVFELKWDASGNLLGGWSQY